MCDELVYLGDYRGIPKKRVDEMAAALKMAIDEGDPDHLHDFAEAVGAIAKETKEFLDTLGASDDLAPG